MAEVYANILEVLTQGLYNRVSMGLREYLQNAYDAIKAARLSGVPEPPEQYHVEVKITRDGKNITVSDNGIGMSESLLKEYTSIGGGTKNESAYAGHKGIGKLAGLRFFELFVVRTKTAGSDLTHELVWRSGDMIREVRANPHKMKQTPYGSFIADFLELRSFPAEDKDSHFTQVQLIDVLDDYADQTNERDIGEFIRATCPVPFVPTGFSHSSTITDFLATDFDPIPTFLNEKVIYQVYTDTIGLRAPVTQEIKYNDSLRARAWFTWITDASEVIPDARISGIRFRCKGICVGDRHLFANNCMPDGRSQFASWFTGEVQVLDDTIRPNTARDGFEHSSALKKFYEEIGRKLGKTLSQLATVRSDIHSSEELVIKTELDKDKGKRISEPTIAKLAAKLKDLRKHKERDEFGLEFSVIDRIEALVGAARDTAEKAVPHIEQEMQTAIKSKDASQVVRKLLQAKDEQKEAPSKAVQKKLQAIIDTGTKAIDSIVTAQPPESSKSAAKNTSLVSVIIAFLQHKHLPFERAEVEEFVAQRFNP